jgi:hypothetical protein
MLLIVPLFLYVLFLEDLLRHKLNLQEAVTSTPWDWHGLNYEKFDRGSNVDSASLDKDQVLNRQSQTIGKSGGTQAPGVWARYMWCDHTSAYNSYNTDFECNDSNHHRAVSAHVCWVLENAQQVACGVDAATGADYIDPLGTIGPLKDEVHKGGEIYCSARAGVLNYFLPQKIFTAFTTVDTTRTTELSGDVHGHYGEKQSAVYLLTMQSMSVVHDPWSQTTVEDVDPPGSGVLQTRTNKIYASPLGWVAYGMADIFILQAVSKELLSPLALVPADTPFSDDLTSANVAFKKDPGGTVDGYYASPWKDWNNDAVKGAYDARGKYYMGATSEPN